MTDTRRKLVTGDATQPYDVSCDIIYTDPPFNIGVDYRSHNDNIDYVFFTKRWISLLPDADWFVCCVDPRHVFLINTYARQRWKFYHQIIWFRTFGSQSNNARRLSHHYTSILCYHKNSWPTWERVPSKRQQIGDKRADPRGKILGDVWEIPMVTGNSRERVGWHPCQQPVELVMRVLRALPGDMVFDPFAGSGSTGVGAIKLGKHFTGFDVDATYVKLANERLQNV